MRSYALLIRLTTACDKPSKRSFFEYFIGIRRHLLFDEAPTKVVCDRRNCVKHRMVHRAK